MKSGEGSREHSAFTDFFRRAPVKVDEGTLSLSKMQESFTRIEQQVQFLMNDRKSDDRFGIEEVTVRLGLSAKGGLAFIAEASIEASMEVKFKRR
ncbi:CU044_2847 family protein [Streptomyces sp. NBC_01276]|uniref:CU044_2847 family protein n=1 Tax=Streptomyces sp. NBC_01276 TaxID=2903808 RepID=UPI00352EADEF